jgi:hypothetical protein
MGMKRQDRERVARADNEQLPQSQMPLQPAELSRRAFVALSMIAPLSSSLIRRAEAQPSDRAGTMSGELRADFAKPPKTFRPMVRWWWPGGDVQDDELRKEIRLLDEANFGGVEIQPFNFELRPDSAPDERARVDDYLSAPFFSHIRAVLDETQHRSMWADYTFGSGWPFGGGEAITPELATIELRFTRLHVRGPVKLHQKLELPDVKLNGADKWPAGWADRWMARSKLVAVVAAKGTDGEYKPFQGWFGPVPDDVVVKSGLLDPSSLTVLTSRVSADGVLDWDVPEGDWLIFAFRRVPPPNLEVTGAVGKGPNFILDHFNRKAFDAHAHRVGDSARAEVGAFFGKSLRAVFVDSLELPSNIYWTDDFLSEFQRLRGYDLTPYLPIIRQPGFGNPFGSHPGGALYDLPDIGDQIRRDYWQTVSDLMIGNLYQPFAGWAHANNLLSRIQAHGSPTDIFKVYGLASIPESEQLASYGSDDFLSMATSAADAFGRQIVSNEAFCFIGDPYGSTPEWFKRNTDRLIVAGVNEIIYHGFPYDAPGYAKPGWYPFDLPLAFGSFLNQNNPFWPYIGELNAYMTRLQMVCQRGVTVNQVAIYRHLLAYDSLGVSGQKPPPQPELRARLGEGGYRSVHMNTETLLRSRVEERQLVTPGGERLPVLVLQDQPAISADLADRLEAFADAGLSIFFVGVSPAAHDGFLDRDAKTARLRAAMTRVLKKPSVREFATVAGLMGGIGGVVRPFVRLTGATGVSFIEKQIGRLRAVFLANGGPKTETVNMEVEAAGAPQSWDAWSGRIAPVADFERAGRDVRMAVELTGFGSRLIVFDPDDHREPKKTGQSKGRPLEPLALDGAGWKFHAAGIGPGGSSIDLDIPMEQLVDWTTVDRLKNFAGRGVYSTDFSFDRKLGNGAHAVLNLGQVFDVAEIKLNGMPTPPLLMRPYQVDVTRLLKPGVNRLEITVVNSLSNAMRDRTAHSMPVPDMLRSPGLQASGLVGPVTITIEHST